MYWYCELGLATQLILKPDLASSASAAPSSTLVGSPEGQGEKRGRATEQVRFVRGDGEGWGGGGPRGEGASSRPRKSAKTTTVKKKAKVAKVAAKGKKAIKKK